MFPIFFTKRKSWCSVIFLVVLSLAAVGVFVYKDTNALSLGKIEVLSSIGQPLKAQVQIGSASKEELSALKVSIASPDFFRKAGVKYSSILSSLVFSVVEKPQGFVIEMTTTEPVKDPFVDVLLDVSWTGGRLVREYTVLLDVTDIETTEIAKTAEQEPLLPTKISLDVPATVLTEKPAEKVNDPVSATGNKPSMDEFKNMTPIAEGERIVGFEKSKKVDPVVVKSLKNSNPRSSVRDSKETYVVQSGDSLSKIAAPLARAANVSLEQVIFLLYNDNREQLSKNLDYLEVGTRLKLPNDPSLVQLVPKAEAKRFVLAYSRNFSKYKQSLASVAKTKGGYGRHNAQSSGRLVDKSSTQVTVANNKPTTNELVLTSPEKISKEGGSNKEITPASANPTQEQQAAVAATSSQVKSDINQAQDNVAEAAGVLTGQTASVAVKSANKKAAPVIVDQVQPPEQNQDFISDFLSDDYALYGLVALVVLGLVGFVVFNRRKNSGSRDQNQETETPTGDPEDDWTPPSFKQQQSTMNEFRSHPSVFAGVTATAALPGVVDTLAAQRGNLASIQKVERNAPVNLAEVDNLIQYKQFREAEALLLTHLRLKPDDIILKQKLAEIYVALDNKEGFESLLSEFLQSASPDVDWTKLAELQSLMDSKQSQVQVQNVAKQSVDSSRESKEISNNNAAQFDALEAPNLVGEIEEDVSPELAKTKFDFSSIDLSLDQSGKQVDGEKTVVNTQINPAKSLDDPLSDSLSTKLELARAYKDIGDISGARQLFQEVASSGKAEFMDRAKAGLESLGNA